MTFRPATCVAILLAFGLLHPGPAAAAFGEGDAQADSSPNRIEPFEAIPKTDSAKDASDLHCTVDGRWCARIDVDERSGDPMLLLLDAPEATEGRETGRYPLAAGVENASLTVWPHIVRTLPANGRRENTALIGVVTSTQGFYSGGSASAARLRLIELNTDYRIATFKEMLSVPLSGSAYIRACFAEKDFEERAGACHDEYEFSAELTLREASAGAPQFNYVTTATSFPGPVSRNEDSTINPPLNVEDLIEVVNDECSYRRVIRFNPATERFEFDSPAPDCSEFTAP